MSEHKAFASLSSGLLARKGSARPAMRRQGFGQVSAAGLDDLGWNDMGDPDYPVDDTPEGEVEGGEVAQFKPNPLAALSPAVSPVHDQRDEIERAFGYTEDEEHHDGDDIYDETAEPWDEEAEGSSIDLGIGGFDQEQSFDKEPKLKRTVADLLPMGDVPAAEEGTDSPLSDFSHLPTDMSSFGKPAEPVAEDEEQPTAFAPNEESFDEQPVSEDSEGEATEEQQPLVEDNRFEMPAWALDSADMEPVAEEEDELVAEDEADEPVAEFETEEPVAEPEISPAASLVDTLNAFETAETEDKFVEEPVEEMAEVEPEQEVVAEDPVSQAPEPVAIEEEPVAAEQEARPSVDLSNVEPIAARSDGEKEKAAFTLRLDKDRHLKLRLACAITGQSAQKFVTEALDKLLADMPELDELADKAPEARKRA